MRVDVVCGCFPCAQYNLSFYFQYLARWPNYFTVVGIPSPPHAVVAQFLCVCIRVCVCVCVCE